MKHTFCFHKTSCYALLMSFLFMTGCSNKDAIRKDKTATSIKNMDWTVFQTCVQSLLPLEINGKQTELHDFKIIDQTDQLKWYEIDSVDFSPLTSNFKERNSGIQNTRFQFDSIVDSSQFMSKENFDAMIDKAIGPSEFWGKFYEMYPNSLGYIDMTLPGYSKDSTKAFFGFSYACGGKCGERYLVWMTQKKNKKWEVSKTKLLLTN